MREERDLLDERHHREIEDYSSRYCISGDGEYVRLHIKLLLGVRLNALQEVRTMQQAEVLLKKAGIGYRHPKVGKVLPAKPDFVTDLTNDNVDNAIILLEHYGYEIDRDRISVR